MASSTSLRAEGVSEQIVWILQYIYYSTCILTSAARSSHAMNIASGLIFVACVKVVFSVRADIVQL